ncbi:MAG: hypothetical protein WCA21_21490 [Terracidiphilus sp.]|jgi:hypothetical protein
MNTSETQDTVAAAKGMKRLRQRFGAPFILRVKSQRVNHKVS